MSSSPPVKGITDQNLSQILSLLKPPTSFLLPGNSHFASVNKQTSFLMPEAKRRARTLGPCALGGA